MTEFDRMKAAYVESGRAQPPEYPPLPTWDELPVELRLAIIHVCGEGKLAGRGDGEAIGELWQKQSPA